MDDVILLGRFPEERAELAARGRAIFQFLGAVLDGKSQGAEEVESLADLTQFARRAERGFGEAGGVSNPRENGGGKRVVREYLPFIVELPCGEPSGIADGQMGKKPTF